MVVRFVYFDAAFTLMHPHPSVGHWYAEHARAFGLEVDGGAIQGAFPGAWAAEREAMGGAAALPYGRTLEEALAFWTRVVRRCFAAAGAEAPADGAYFRRVFDAFADGDCWRLYPDVLPALDALEAAGVGCGVLSNFDARLHGVLRELGVAQRFRCAVISSEAGAEKPDAAIFAAAEAAAGVRGAEIALVGDEPDADGRGPIAAGWSQCLVWRRPSPPPAGMSAAATLDGAVRRLLAEG